MPKPRAGPVYFQIKNDPTLAAGEQVALGVRPINRARSRIGAPVSSPVLFVADDRVGVHLLTYVDETSRSRVAKPTGTIGLQVARHLGAGPARSIDDLTYLATYTRSPARILYSNADDLKIATYAARWIDRRGQTGPWSSPVVRRVISNAMRPKSLAA